jgi:curved DNA-binding protein CbpA
MRKIVDYRKLLGATKDSDLKELKSLYRTFMKDWHPDKFHGDAEKLKEAEEKSKSFIEAYHFLVSVAPETREQELPEYTQIINSSRIMDFEYKLQVLTINFLDGSAYEYFDIPKNVYTKFLNSDTPDRFARRHIYHSFVYRKASKATVTA